MADICISYSKINNILIVFKKTEKKKAKKNSWNMRGRCRKPKTHKKILTNGQK
jgi:hypothetical protein